MKLPIADLRRALGAVAAAVPRRPSMPILSSVHIRIDGDKATFTSTNLDLSISHTIDLDEQEYIDILVDHRLLSGIVRQWASDYMQLDEGDAQATISSPGSEYHLPLSPVADYPAIRGPSDGVQFSIPCSVLRPAANCVLHAIGEHLTQPTIGGMYLCVNGRRLTMTGTDTHQLSTVTIDVETDQECEVVVPKEAVIAMRELDGDVSVVVSENSISMSSDETTICSLLYDVKYPNYRPLIVEPTVTALAQKDDLLSALGRIGLCAEKRVRITVTPDMAHFTASGNSMLSASEKIAVSSDGEFEVMLYPDYLNAAIRSIQDDDIRLQYTGDQTPVLLRPRANDHTCLVMPMRAE